MESLGELRPEQARDAGEFAVALRQLKACTGLTYRQLEERAAEHGDVLARSTLADVLSGRTTPRPELLIAFLRACGVGPAEMRTWIRARERIAAASGTQGDERVASATRDGERAPEQVPWWSRWPAWPVRRRGVVGTVALLVIVVIAGVAYIAMPAGGPKVVKASSGSAAASSPCGSDGCRGKDPEQHGCLYDGRRVNSVKTEAGLVNFFHSLQCRSLWAEISHDPALVSIYMKNDTGEALSMGSRHLKRTAPSAGTMVRTPMLPSAKAPRHAEVCATYRQMEACVSTDNMTRVKPYPTQSAG
ncbi:helix-turn-helix domain-containing protein [Streptomyces bullii]|uniref:Helix-turn-helix domain-containing protein n=1 Tax=Streptomyces bullii TaxID=349910 RepID=A0ABW0UX45_9ACTN